MLLSTSTMDREVKVYLHSSSGSVGDWRGQTCVEFPISSWWTIDELKKAIMKSEGVPIEAQHIYPGRIDDSHTTIELELGGEMKLSSLMKEYNTHIFTLVLKPTILTEEGLEERLPHISAKIRQKLLAKLKKIKVLDEDLIREQETVAQPISGSMILDLSTNKSVKSIIKGGQTLVPVSYDEAAQTIEFRPNYGYEYFVSTPKKPSKRPASDDRLIEDKRRAIVDIETNLKDLKEQILQLKSSANYDSFELCCLLLEHEETACSLSDARHEESELTRDEPELFHPAQIRVHRSPSVSLGLGIHTFDGNSYKVVEDTSDSKITGKKRKHQDGVEEDVSNEDDEMDEDDEDDEDEEDEVEDEVYC